MCALLDRRHRCENMWAENECRERMLELAQPRQLKPFPEIPYLPRMISSKGIDDVVDRAIAHKRTDDLGNSAPSSSDCMHVDAARHDVRLCRYCRCSVCPHCLK